MDFTQTCRRTNRKRVKNGSRTISQFSHFTLIQDPSEAHSLIGTGAPAAAKELTLPVQHVPDFCQPTLPAKSWHAPSCFQPGSNDRERRKQRPEREAQQQSEPGP